MADFVHNDVLDASLNYIKTNCTHIHLLPSLIENYADIASNSIGSVVAPALTLGNGSVGNSRKLSFANFDVTATKNGNISFLAFVDTTNSSVLAVIEMFLPKTVENGEKITIQANEFEIGL